MAVQLLCHLGRQCNCASPRSTRCWAFLFVKPGPPSWAFQGDLKPALQLSIPTCQVRIIVSLGVAVRMRRNLCNVPAYGVETP